LLGYHATAATVGEKVNKLNLSVMLFYFVFMVFNIKFLFIAGKNQSRQHREASIPYCSPMPKGNSVVFFHKPCLLKNKKITLTHDKLYIQDTTGDRFTAASRHIKNGDSLTFQVSCCDFK